MALVSFVRPHPIFALDSIYSQRFRPTGHRSSTTPTTRHAVFRRPRTRPPTPLRSLRHPPWGYRNAPLPIHIPWCGLPRSRLTLRTLASSVDPRFAEQGPRSAAQEGASSFSTSMRRPIDMARSTKSTRLAGGNLDVYFDTSARKRPRMLGRPRSSLSEHIMRQQQVLAPHARTS